MGRALLATGTSDLATGAASPEHHLSLVEYVTVIITGCQARAHINGQFNGTVDIFGKSARPTHHMTDWRGAVIRNPA